LPRRSTAKAGRERLVPESMLLKRSLTLSLHKGEATPDAVTDN